MRGVDVALATAVVLLCCLPELCTAQCGGGSYFTANLTCAVCPVGYFCLDGTNAVPCPAGSFNNNTGAAGPGACNPCPFGYHGNNSVGLEYCYGCPTGTENPTLGAVNASACDQCSPGHATGQTGTPACLPCSPGSYAVGFGNTICTQCGPGTNSSEPAASAPCSPCPPGTAASGYGTQLCPLCLEGSYANSSGAEVCADCPAGTYGSLKGLDRCDDCSGGTYVNYTGAASPLECASCPAGKYSGDGAAECEDCPAGTDSTPGSSTCDDCVAGSYASTPGTPTCLPCPPGTYENGTGSTLCTPCGSGTAWPFTGRTEACPACGPGTQAPGTGNDGCDPCPAGTASNSSGVATCPGCGVGSFSNSPGARVCTPCGAGSFAATTNTTECTPCSPGTASSDTGRSSACPLCAVGSSAFGYGSQVCTPCAAGSYAAFGGLSNCTLCAPGTAANDTGRTTECGECGVGTFALGEGAQECTNCPAGTFANETKTAFCLPCPAGSFNPLDGQSECTACPRRTYNPFTNQVSALACVDCPVGTASNDTGAGSCPECPPGTTAGFQGQPACDPCPAGSFASGYGNTLCLPCNPGFYNPFAGQAQCIGCDPGYALGGYGNTLPCNQCGQGTYAAGYNNSMCSPCPRGTASTALGAEVCTDCDPGEYMPEEGQLNCWSCPVGTSQDDYGQWFCDSCPPGQYQPDQGTTSCDTCTRGTFAADWNATECENCGIGEGSGRGASECSLCPPGRYNDAEGSACTKCPPGTYTADDGSTECVECPVGGRPDYTHTQCLPQAGFAFDPDNAGVFVACPVPEACCASGQCAPCSSDKDPFYQGDTCEQCAPDHYSPNNDGVCQPCPQYSLGILIGSGVVIIVLCIGLVRSAKSASYYFTSLSVAFNFFQLTAVMASFDLPWPDLVKQALSFTSVFYFNVDIIQVDCLGQDGGLDYATKFYGKLLLPGVFTVVFVLIFVYLVVSYNVYYYCCRRRGGSGHSFVSGGGEEGSDVDVAAVTFDKSDYVSNLKYRWACVNAALCLLSALYILITITIFEVWDCVPHPLEPGRIVMRAAPVITCHSQKWYDLRYWAFIGGAVYVVGIPLMFAGLLKLHRNSLHEEFTVARFGLLYRRYTPSEYLWELVIMGRKLGVAVSSLVASVTGDPAYQLASLVVVVCLATALQLTQSPYVSRRVNRLETLSIVCSLIILGSGLLFFVLLVRVEDKVLTQEAYDVASLVGGYIVVGFIILFTLVVIGAVLEELYYLHKMKAHGITGGYATNDVSYEPHFFRSQLCMEEVDDDFVTTTDHTSLKIFYKAKRDSGFPVAVQARLVPYAAKPEPVKPTKFNAAADKSGSDGSDDGDGDGEDHLGPCSLLVQHDAVRRFYQIDILAREAGRYKLIVSGGAVTDPSTNLLCCVLGNAEDGRNAWHPSRLLFEYSLEVTKKAVALPLQEFVSLKHISELHGTVYRPLKRHLPVGVEYDFELELYQATDVVVEVVKHIGEKPMKRKRLRYNELEAPERKTLSRTQRHYGNPRLWYGRINADHKAHYFVVASFPTGVYDDEGVNEIVVKQTLLHYRAVKPATLIPAGDHEEAYSEEEFESSGLEDITHQIAALAEPVNDPDDEDGYADTPFGESAASLGRFNGSFNASTTFGYIPAGSEDMSAEMSSESLPRNSTAGGLALEIVEGGRSLLAHGIARVEGNKGQGSARGNAPPEYAAATAGRSGGGSGGGGGGRSGPGSQNGTATAGASTGAGAVELSYDDYESVDGGGSSVDVDSVTVTGASGGGGKQPGSASAPPPSAPASAVDEYDYYESYEGSDVSVVSTATTATTAAPSTVGGDGEGYEYESDYEYYES